MGEQIEKGVLEDTHFVMWAPAISKGREPSKVQRY